jgi:sigma-B regulation protein RsbU (phosphoserine phosphatase)
MLPRELPAAGGYTVAARLLPCFEAGGDLYEAAMLPNGMLLLAVGDVSGKGMGAALLMSQTLGAMRLLAEESPPLEEMALRLYRQVTRSAAPGRFVTLFFGRLHPSTHRLEYVNCGHNPPYVFSVGGERRELPTTGLPLGILPVELMPPGILTSASVDLAPGDLLCIFSDGIPEAARDGEFFGEERLEHGVRSRFGLPLDEIAEGVLEDVRAFYGGAPVSDDITLLLVRREGTS